MIINGLGIMSPRGRGTKALEQALTEGWQAPEMEPGPVYRVSRESLKDKTLFRKIRRADRFTKMAVFAAVDAAKDANLDDRARAEMGLILSTAFGPHATTFQFLDDVLDFGEKEVSPTKFSHSVHNAAAFYVASVLGCRGPAVTVTNFAFSFHHALALAQAWLAAGKHEHVLIGAVDETHTVMEYICARKLALAFDGKIQPFNGAETPVAVPGEGSAFFLLSNQSGNDDYGRVSEIGWSTKPADLPVADVTLWDADGMTGDESRYLKLHSADSLIGSFTPIFGSSLTVSALHTASAALMTRNRRVCHMPITENPHNLALYSPKGARNPKTVSSVRINCDDELGWITVCDE